MSERVNKARARLNSLKGTWRKVAEQAGVSYSWLAKFAIGKVPDPGVSRLEAVERVIKNVRLPANWQSASATDAIATSEKLS